MSTIVIAGMEVEARIARRAGLQAVVAGGSPERRMAIVERATRDGATGLISFGIAGGLDPKLSSGAVILPEKVHAGMDQEYVVDAAWRHRLLAHIPHAVSGTIFGAAVAVARVIEKKSLFDRTGAVAVDLESAIVAQVAERAAIPFVVLRTIADSAHRELPHAALIALNGDGKVAFGAVLGFIARKPGQVPALMRLAIETRRALNAMDAFSQPVHAFHAAPA